MSQADNYCMLKESDKQLLRAQINRYLSGAGCSKDLSKFKTILANEVINTGPIGPAISIWLAQ